MGRIYSVITNLYADSAYTNLIASFPGGRLGLAVGSVENQNSTDVYMDYNFFTDRVSGDYMYLGGDINVPSSITLVQNAQRISSWLPLCRVQTDSFWNSAYYLEYVFANGYKMRRIAPIDTQGSFYYRFYDNENREIGSFRTNQGGDRIYNAIYNLYDVQETDYVVSFDALVVSKMNPNGTIPNDAIFAEYYIYAGAGRTVNGRVVNFGTEGSAPWINFFNSVPGKKYESDPYGPISPSGPGGGNQPYNPFGTDDIGYELLPEVSAVGTGFVSLWCPTEQQMLNLSAYMWNADALTLDFWRKLVADPLQLVYGLNIIPLNLRSMGIVGDTPDDVVVGAISTGIKMDYLTSQWVELDCGTIDIDESILGSYLDYDPFTKVEIYLPYIGYRPLRVDDIMPGTIQLKYRIDLLTGSCVAQIKATKSSLHDDTLNSVIYQFMGNCATQIPVTASQYADAVRSAITAAAAIGTVVALAGTGAAVGAAAGAELMPTSDPVGLLSSPGMVPVDSELGMSMARYSQMTSATPASASVGGGNSLKNIAAMHSAASAGSNVMSIKPSIERSGAISGASGLLSIQTPYVVFTRPRVARPDYQNTFMGYPSFMTKALSSLRGFTQIQAIHLEGIPCTAGELAEIDALLKSGVIF